MTDAVKDCSKDHILILGVDTNCKLGRNNHLPPQEGGERTYLTLGKFSLPQTNERGIAFKNFLAVNELCATNTFFKKITQATKFCTLGNIFYTTDFIIMR